MPADAHPDCIAPPPVYSNSFMASLNSRARIFTQKTSSNGQPSIATRTDFQMGDLPTVEGGAHSLGNTVEIHISRMIETDGGTTGKCDSAPQVGFPLRRSNVTSDGDLGRLGIMTVMGALKMLDRH